MRPEGCMNPYKEPIREGVTWNEEVIQAWEEGADAMLDGLKKGGFILGEALVNTKTIGWSGISPTSKWYVISD